MARRKQEPISMKFIFFIVFMIGLTIFYLLQHDEVEDINKKTPTYEEQLEYHDGQLYHEIAEEKKEEIKSSQNRTSNARRKRTEINQYQQETQTRLQTEQPEEKYKRLLDSLKNYPYKSSYYINVIVDQLLIFKGYPQGLVKVSATNLNQSRAKVQGSYLVANFDFKSGKLYIEESILNQLSATTLIAVLVHELDHFDKLANLCRYTGVDQFENILNRNGILNVDTTFWRMASTFGKTKNFNGEEYKDALERFVSQNKIQDTGAYSTFYKLAENLRNPLEISAYKESDYVYNHYGITIQEGPTQKLVKKFNDIDWAIYSKIAYDNILKTERVSVFDYYYSKAVLEQMPDLANIYNSCLTLRNGDLTNFWTAYKNKLNTFYKNNGQLNATDYSTIISLLNSTQTKLKDEINKEDIALILKNKINTEKNSTYTEENIKNFEKTLTNYINYTNTNEIKDDKQTLITSILLICIENKLYKNKQNEEISLYYLNMPDILMRINKIANKKQKLLFLYNNPAFKTGKPNHLSEQEYLIQLINQNRINVN